MVIKDPVLVELAAAKGVSPAQVVLRWHVQRGCVALVKTSKIERLPENIGVFGFELIDEEMAKVSALD